VALHMIEREVKSTFAVAQDSTSYGAAHDCAAFPSSALISAFTNAYKAFSNVLYLFCVTASGISAGATTSGAEASPMAVARNDAVVLKGTSRVKRSTSSI